MTHVIGVFFVLVGALLVIFRDRISQGNAAQNRAMFNGPGGGSRTIAYGRVSNAVGGSIAVILGVLLIVGVIG